MPYQQVSFIKDLPELEQLESYDNNNQVEGANMVGSAKRQPGIRNKMTTLSEESGMSLYEKPAPAQSSVPYPQQFQYQQRPPTAPYYHNQPQNVIPIEPNPMFNGEVIENMSFPSSPVLDCRSIFSHIDSCPICKKFYKMDNTVYLIIIAILVITCALMLKRLLRV
jgi:hypothetical protein